MTTDIQIASADLEVSIEIAPEDGQPSIEVLVDEQYSIEISLSDIGPKGDKGDQGDPAQMTWASANW